MLSMKIIEVKVQCLHRYYFFAKIILHLTDRFIRIDNSATKVQISCPRKL